MRVNVSGSRAGWLLAASALLAACSDKSLSPIDAGKPGKHDAAVSDAAASDAGGVSLTACNDGTGRTNCCSEAPKSGAACSFSDGMCWTRCTQGFTSQAACSDGTLTLGHGLFPCDGDASTASEDDGGASAACTPESIMASDYDQSCALDSDCVGVGQGSPCTACALACATGAINKKDENRYTSDVKRSKWKPPSQSGAHCGCPALFPVCCMGGTCRADAQCSER